MSPKKTKGRSKRRPATEWETLIRQQVRSSGLSLYRVAKDATIGVGIVQRFMAGERGLNLRTAEKICRVLGLRLMPGAGSSRKGR